MWTKGFRKIGIGLMVILSIILLLIVAERKKPRTAESPKRIALFKYSSRQTLDDTERGYIDGLAARGYVDGGKIELTLYNSQNDLPTANTVASGIVNGGFDMVITASTPALQVMANANKEGKLIHIFGTVTDPFAAGVGLDRDNPLVRPKHLAGAGTFQPVEKAFLIAREMNPDLKKVGVVWCLSESCSEACVLIARRVCDSLGITLVESTVDSSIGVMEAAQALVAKGVEAIWIGGDNTVEIAADMVIKAANGGKIPVFTNNTDHPALGAMFGIGANYYEVGLNVGNIAADVLEGKDPATISVENVVPERLIINGSALKAAGASWSLTDALKVRADTIL